ncbi:MAG: hypothetical protein HY320_01620 [Armatimonadetes bacterium]|nr:hypothetical protein [Armatimonadota bacterium]
MKRRAPGGWLGAAGLVVLMTSLAAAQNGEEAVGPLPRQISVLVTREPLVSAAFTGRYGPMRLTGTLVGAPQTPLTLADLAGQTREARWDEIRELTVVRTVTADLPAGSFTAVLSGDPGALSRPGLGVTGGYSPPGVRVLRSDQPLWRVRSLPEGELVLRGEPFGEARVPIARLTELVMQPITGSTTTFPDGVLRLEVEDGATVDLSLRAVQSYRRDTAAGVATVTLIDGQMFSGKIVQLPAAAYEVEKEGTGERVRLPLDRIAQMEIIAPPAGPLAVGNSE